MEMEMETVNSSLQRLEAGSSLQVVSQADHMVLLKAFIVVPTSIALFGIVANIFNIRTFHVLGLNDGVTIGFFALSVSDLFFLCVLTCFNVSSILPIIEMGEIFWFPVDPYVLLFFSGNAMFICSYFSMFLVTFLAVVRCLCVSMPLHFKSMFTKSRCIVVIIAFAIIAIGIYIPIFANMGVQRQFYPSHNASRIVMWFSGDRERIKDIIWLIFDTILPVVVEIVLIACAILMAFALQKSAKFRQGRKAQTTTDNPSATPASDTKLSSRDLRVVYQVILISVIYVIACMPKVFNSLYTQIQPEFDVNGRLHYLYLALVEVRITCECINAAVNVFVYYKFNSAFRAALFQFKKQAKR